MRLLRISGFLVLTGLATSIVEADLCACAPVSRQGESVHIDEESALIVWDKENKTQHFIRRAQFESQAKDFGFMVPTPTKPSLSEVDDAIFDRLETITRPPPKVEARASVGPLPASAISAPPSAVTVLESVTVAGLDAVVLAANDAKALNDWLVSHGYHSNAELVEWFKPYIKSQWLLTAFKISKGKSTAGRATTTAVRMSFQTEKPFFPYREPPSKRTTPRALEIYVLSSERVYGSIGWSKVSTSTTPPDWPAQTLWAKPLSIWPAQTLWAKPLSIEDYESLVALARLKGTGTKTTHWLTRFVDHSSIRPGSDDVYFSPASSQMAHIDENGLHTELRRKEAARAEQKRLMWKNIENDGRTFTETGISLENSGNIRGAIRLYLRAVKEGEFAAAKRLGDIYWEGKGDVLKDRADAIRYYQLAEKNGIKVDRKK